MSFPNDRTYQADVNLFFSDNAAAYTASGALQVGGAAAIVDLGGNQGTSPVQQARIEMVAVLDVTAIDISSTNETYKFLVNVSNDPAFGAGNVVNAGAIELGYLASTDVVNGASSVTGRYEVMFTNNIAGSIYEYAQVYLIAGGTTPSISVSGFFATLPTI
jgi:hypothetical protein